MGHVHVEKYITLFPNQTGSWQVDANIFKVMRYSLLRDFYLVSLYFVVQ